MVAIAASASFAENSQRMCSSKTSPRSWTDGGMPNWLHGPSDTAGDVQSGRLRDGVRGFGPRPRTVSLFAHLCGGTRDVSTGPLEAGLAEPYPPRATPKAHR